MAVRKGSPGRRQAQPRCQGRRRSRRSNLRPKRKINNYACFARETRSYDPSMEGRKNIKAPKRPMSAFLLFCQEYRPQLRADHPNLSLVQESRRLGAIWRGLGKKEYERFANLAAQLRKKYRKDMKKYKKAAKKMSLRRERVAGKRRREEVEEEDSDDSEESMDD
ncbi:high mobility group protein C-like [Suncus etruscus]|uniref:high mobility group protein C-like n=1 Tax=Suncus etruscus TaxID=109475 RepID=UPI00210F66B5|nr:high mobility group protein C-like [Suncus etruscus]